MAASRVRPARLRYPRLMAEYSHTSEHHRLHVADNGGVRTLRFERNQQSSMLLDDPFATDIEYVAYLHLACAVVPDPTRALVVGLGGGMLVKQLWRDHPPLTIDAVELDAEVADIAREFFGLPDDPRVAVHVCDGREFVEHHEATYDIVVIDAYDDDRIPRHLTTEEFMRAVYSRLRPDGVVAYNVIGSVSGTHSKPLRSLYRTAANVWGRVWLFPVKSADPGGPQPENVVLLATDASLAKGELLARITSRAAGSVSVPGFERFGEHLYHGRLRTGDVPIIIDPPAHKHRRPAGL